jgi:steroid 5-alpha reductase family enzyme
MSFLGYLLLLLGLSLALHTVLWIISQARGSMTVFDPFWGLSFVVLMPVMYALGARTDRGVLALFLITVWGMRYAIYLYTRQWGRTEESLFYPYKEWRKGAGRHWWWISIFRTLLAQSLGVAVAAVPILLCMHQPAPAELGLVEGAGVAVWLLGMLYEAVADHQLAQFKHDPANKGKVMRSGLWRFSRHPNYFGDAVMWWGIFLLGLPTPLGLWGLASPLVMTVLLRGWSGVPMVEAHSRIARSAEYADYVASTNAFFPGPPRSRLPRDI